MRRNQKNILFYSIEKISLNKYIFKININGQKLKKVIAYFSTALIPQQSASSSNSLGILDLVTLALPPEMILK